MAPPRTPHGDRPKLCRFPRCNSHVFIDRRVNEMREWCSDQHMQEAIRLKVERPCNVCRIWPRLNGYKRCSGNLCRYSYPGRQAK